MGKLPMIFFDSNGRLKKKNSWAHDGRGAHDLKKIIMGAKNKKKTMGSAHFLKIHFFGAHDPGIPKVCTQFFITQAHIS